MLRVYRKGIRSLSTSCYLLAQRKSPGPNHGANNKPEVPIGPKPLKELSTLTETEKMGWVEVVDKDSGKTYWWHVPSGVTTQVGEPKPGEFVSFRSSLMSSFLWGGGMAVAFGLIFRLFG